MVVSHFRQAADEAEQATADAADMARSERATAVRETGRLERQIPLSTCQGSPRLCGGQRLALWNRLRQWRLVHFASERQWRLASKADNGRRAWKWNRHRRRGRRGFAERQYAIVLAKVRVPLWRLQAVRHRPLATVARRGRRGRGALWRLRCL